MHYQKNPILIEDVDIDKLLMSINVSSGGKKYESFNGYKTDDYEIKLLSLILSETSTYEKVMMMKLYGCFSWLKMVNC